MEDYIQKKGMLYHQQQRFGKRWRKVWAVALSSSTHSVARLELFEYRQASVQESRVGKRADSKKVILLRDCIQIVQQEHGDCPKNCASFLLETAQRLFTFAAQKTELQSWIQELCKLAFPLNQSESSSVRQGHVRDHLPVDMKENTLYGSTACTQDVQVIVVGTEAAVRCNLHGEYILTVQKDSLLLKDAKSKQVIFSWPYCYIRKFGQDMLTFSFEAGRRCESGEGCFEFATSYGDHLFTSITEAINNLPNTERSGFKQSCEKTKNKDKPLSQVKGDMCEGSTIVPSALPAAGRSQKPHLNSMFRSLSLSSFDPAPKGQEKSVRDNLPPQQEQEPLYAMITKAAQPQAQHMSSSPSHQPRRDYSPWTDPLGLVDAPLPEKVSADRPAQPTKEDHSAEAIYAEPEDYTIRAAWEYHCEYPSLDEFWPSNEVKDIVEESDEAYSLFPPPPPSTSTTSTINMTAESCLTYDNINVGRK